MENRNGLIVQAELTHADGQGERQAALKMIHRHAPGSTRQLTLGADKGYDSADFVAHLRQACGTPHIAQKARYAAIDRRTTRHSGYAVSRKARKKIEAPFGWAKTFGGMAQTTHRGIEKSRYRKGACQVHNDNGSQQAGEAARPVGGAIRNVEIRSHPQKPHHVAISRSNTRYKPKPEFVANRCLTKTETFFRDLLTIVTNAGPSQAFSGRVFSRGCSKPWHANMALFRR